MDGLRKRLSSSVAHADISTELRDQLATLPAESRLRDTGQVPDEPYRQLSSCIAFRLRLALSDKTDPRAYRYAQDFSGDLRIMRESLAGHKAERMARLFVDPLIRQADTFGFTSIVWISGSTLAYTRGIRRRIQRRSRTNT